MYMKQQCMNIQKRDSASGHPNYLAGHCAQIITESASLRLSQEFLTRSRPKVAS